MGLSFSTYQQDAVSTAIYPNDFRIIYPALGLSGEAGEVAEKIKKMVRDDGGVLTSERRDALKKELGDVLWYLANIANDAGLNLEDIALANIAKLFSRKERGVLQGDGDER